MGSEGHQFCNIHSVLFLKLLCAKIGGQFLAWLKSLYSNLSLRVIKIVNSHSLSNAFPSNVGVFQGDNLRPNLFNLYINGLIDDFDHSCSPVLLGQKHISCLLYADDLVLLSESQEGIQNCLNKTWEYCKSWGLEINYTKSKAHLTWRGGYGFFLKKYSVSQCCWKKYSDFGGGKKKSDSEFLSYNLMWNSGIKFRTLRDKKNKYSNSCVVRKKIYERNKKP
jgi:hypothetical protein